jgi:hypothetical protein
MFKLAVTAHERTVLFDAGVGVVRGLFRIYRPLNGSEQLNQFNSKS